VPRLTVALPTDFIKRQMICGIAIALHNLRVRRAGLNQLRTIYGAVWAEANGGPNELLDP